MSEQITVDLTGQLALVTGASRGIGRAIAQSLARCGAEVACVGRNKEKLAETVKLIEDAGGKAKAYECDVADGKSVQAMVDEIAEANNERIDILVNNAGICRDTLLPRMDDDQWDDVINTNLRGTFLFTRAVTNYMMRSRYGRVINLASVSGLVGNKGQANYSASKAGIIGFTRTVALELAKRGVTVNAVAPGFILTDMTEGLGAAAQDEIIKRIPVKKLGQPEDIAEAVLFLSSKAAGYITGQTLTIDGGMTV